MHFSIPDTQELNEGNGSTYIGYNIHINGIFHCTVRYKQLHNLHEQLKKEFGNDNLPPFPPKKLLPLTGGQLEDRRALLEKYIQTVGQDPKLVSSELLVGFLLSAQQETTCEKRQEVNLDVYTSNNYQIPLTVSTFDRTEQVLIKVFKQINLPLQYLQYFSLYLIKKDNNGDVVVLRKLLSFESPYMTHKTVRDSNKIVIRKSYWDCNYDQELMTDPVALNLLYVQVVSDVEKGWICCTRDMKSQLSNLQSRLAKREYIELARTLKYYGFMQFMPCYCDFPKPQTKVLIAIGDQELSMRLLGTGQFVKEGSFKVTRMRCWRITATHNKQDMAANSHTNASSGLELSFEYLMSKDKLQWITVSSEQAILMSVCLQSLVDELLMKKNGVQKKQPPMNKGNWSYMKRDGSCHLISLDDVNSNSREDGSAQKYQESFSIKKLQEKFSSVSFKTGKEFIENHAFEGIGDDDL
ncbi:sorting nexin-17 [Tribolium castaneum]|uniref:Sorting nexin-17-like Protein n=1 Tax=Tribolium castaneum TaxID=7070 RepID=A0A139WNV0_TRICA|nr:PREDICTED: sorting nexin-17 [Tribolium castaneum]XP_969378.2 PREDICTED: sorting nexin-17 [Tribolium castaneum]KYB29604.1 Sorting nexin-17-like Protein [Tribolium castaneum]|eukprot:XP_008200527.1 PREDICTED: sorting nexin-17 [Tribolium castaneum]